MKNEMFTKTKSIEEWQDFWTIDNKTTMQAVYLFLLAIILLYFLNLKYIIYISILCIIKKFQKRKRVSPYSRTGSKSKAD